MSCKTARFAALRLLLTVLLFLLPAGTELRALQALPPEQDAAAAIELPGLEWSRTVHVPEGDALRRRTSRASVAVQAAGGPAGGGHGSAFAGLLAAPAAWRAPREVAVLLRRWLLLHSAVRGAQLRALYPEHGFW